VEWVQTVILAKKQGGRQFGDFRDQQSAFGTQHSGPGQTMRTRKTLKRRGRREKPLRARRKAFNRKDREERPQRTQKKNLEKFG
jgi:hypothetical protein